MAMSQEHKKALAQGRKEARSITAYLESLRPRRRGRPITEASVRRRLEGVRERIKLESNPLRRVELVQKRIDLERQLADLGSRSDSSSLEADFLRYARAYGERKKISYAAWREAGVPAAVLAKAGIKR